MAFEEALNSTVHACCPRFHPSLLGGLGDGTSYVEVVCRCSAAKRLRKGKEVVAVRVGGGVPRAPCFNAVAYARSKVPHGEAVGVGHSDAPAVLCEEGRVFHLPPKGELELKPGNSPQYARA